MTFRSIAYKNIKHHHKSYLSYFLSCSFAVCLFFLYTSLLVHPILQDPTIPDAFISLVFLVEGVVALFSLLFIGYSQSAFLRNRKQDLGLFQVLGMSVNQVTRMLLWENLLVGLLAMVVGISSGLIFDKLFFLGISAVLGLENPIPFVFSTSAILLTLSFFTCLFILLSWWGRRQVKRVSIAELFREVVQEKKAPVFSIWLVMGSIGCIGVAYGLGWDVSLADLIPRLIPILLLILIGTYTAFTQVSVAVISYLEKIPSIYYRGKNMLLLAQLRFRLRDNARILFMVTILTSIVITAVSVCATYYIESEKVAEEQAPYHLSIEGEPAGLTTEMIKKQFTKHHLQMKQEIHFPVLFVKPISSPQTKISLLSNSDFNRLLKHSTQLAPVQVPKGEVIISMSSGVGKEEIQSIPKQQVQLQINGQTASFTIQKRIQSILFNEHDSTRMMWVVNDETYKQLAQVAAPNDRILIHAYQFDDWRRSEALIEDLLTYLKRADHSEQTLKGTAVVYQLLKDIFAPLMFVSLFIGVLFFLATGSILYFRLFTEIPADQKQMNILGKLGIQTKDAMQILVWQIRLLFFIPFVAGFIHASVAMKMFSFLFQKPVWNIFAVIGVVYLVIEVLYYMWTRRMVLQAVLWRKTLS